MAPHAARACKTECRSVWGWRQSDRGPAHRSWSGTSPSGAAGISRSQRWTAERRLGDKGEQNQHWENTFIENGLLLNCLFSTILSRPRFAGEMLHVFCVGLQLLLIWCTYLSPGEGQGGEEFVFHPVHHPHDFFKHPLVASLIHDLDLRAKRAVGHKSGPHRTRKTKTDFSIVTAQVFAVFMFPSTAHRWFSSAKKKRSL